MKEVDSSTLARPSSPERMCIGCRGKASKDDLLRVVSDGARVVPDLAAVHPGRGAYLHWGLDCFELAVKKRAFTRSLRVLGALDDSPVHTVISADRTDQPHVSREHRMSTP